MQTERELRHMSFSSVTIASLTKNEIDSWGPSAPTHRELTLSIQNLKTEMFDSVEKQCNIDVEKATKTMQTGIEKNSL